MTVFDTQYKRYDAWYDRYPYAYASELAALRKVVPTRGRGLEIGVGTGRFAKPLDISVGIDPSKNMVRIARERGIDARIGYGERLPFKKATFDYVAIIITLCFVRDPVKVIQEARRVLKKKGQLIVGIIDKRSFLGALYQRKKSVFYKHAHFFSVPEFTDLLRAAGFNRFSYYQTIFKPPATILSGEKPHKGFGKGGFVIISSHKKN